MTHHNGQAKVPPTPAGPPQMMELRPIEVSLNACTFDVVQRPDGIRVVRFLHQSGALAYLIPLTPQGAVELCRQLTGVEIAQHMPT